MNEVENLKNLVGHLAEEVRYITKTACGSNSTQLTSAEIARFPPIQRRLLIRSVFSFIEAVVFHLKVGALLVEPTILSVGEIALAKEEDYELDNDGEVKTAKAKLRLIQNIKFAFKIAAKSHRQSFALNLSCVEWEALKKSIPVRDRLMHPKKGLDLEVTDEEVGNALKAFEWVFEQAFLVNAMALSASIIRRKRNQSTAS